ncbi:AAA family ATPase [Paramicrobacterium agarici]|uniref:Cellulose biosynthesis protein BcsQ n=1 Tax=Paramicrobacterium agarici TaxID=630514 RepID=A0A2A9DWB3_9MICO|nr:P-loop NTPase [Microbacterium agarici]PFG30864.1 cellulose biosynthesis protein BcsQ [Microbacterium agarici]
MTRLVLAVSRETEERILEPVLERGHDVLARLGPLDDVAEIVARTRPDALLADGDVMSEELLARCDDCGCRAVAVCSDEGQRRHVSRLGLREHVDSHASIAQLEAAIAGPDVSTATAERSRGIVTSVWGPAGAPGRTTLAISLSVELAALGARVCLIDADTWGASVAQMLGMLDESPGFAAACRLAGHGALTHDELDRISERYPVADGSLVVLTGLTRASRWPELTTSRVTDTVETCRQWVDHVVIDTGFSLESDEEISSDLFAPRRNAATLAALRASDRVMAVGRADPVGISRYLRQHAELLEVVAGIPVHTVMNRVRSGPIGVAPAGQIASTLQRFGGIEKPTMIANDDRAADAALLEGRSLREVAPRSPAGAAIASLARSMMPEAATPATRRERRARSAPTQHPRAWRLSGRATSSP